MLPLAVLGALPLQAAPRPAGLMIDLLAHPGESEVASAATASIPYEADACLNQLSHYATDREFTLARVTQAYLLRHPTWPTEWKQFSVLIAWQDYLHTGDKRPLEAWDTPCKPNLDWNHAWGAAPANLIPRFLMGVRPLAPAFANVLVEPRLGSLQWIELRLPTIRDPIRLRCEQAPENFRARLELPGATRAEVSLPAGPQGLFTVDGAADSLGAGH